MPLHPLLLPLPLPQPFSLPSLAFPSPTSSKRNICIWQRSVRTCHARSVFNWFSTWNPSTTTSNHWTLKKNAVLEIDQAKKTEKPKNILKIGRTFSFDICWSQARWLIKYPLAVKACMQACLVDTSWHLSRFHFEAAVWIGKPCLMSLCIILCGSSLSAFCSYFRTGSKHRHRFASNPISVKNYMYRVSFSLIVRFWSTSKNEKHLMTSRTSGRQSRTSCFRPCGAGTSVTAFFFRRSRRESTIFSWGHVWHWLPWLP